MIYFEYLSKFSFYQLYTFKEHHGGITHHEWMYVKLMPSNLGRDNTQHIPSCTFASRSGSVRYAVSSSSESESAMWVSSCSKAWSMTLIPSSRASFTLGMSSASRCSLVFSFSSLPSSPLAESSWLTSSS